MNMKEASFKELTVSAGCSATFSNNEVPAGSVPVWIEIPDEIADHFVITDVKVGRTSQLLSTGAVPATLFARSAPRDELLMDAVAAEFRGFGSLKISVANLSSEDRNFSAKALFSDGINHSLIRRQRIIGLGVSKVAPHGTCRMTVQPMLPVCPDRLHVPPSLLDKVEVSSLEIFTWTDGTGRDELIDSVPVELLRRYNLETVGGIWLQNRKIKHVTPGECFVVQFENKTDESVNVRGAILGGKPNSWEEAYNKV